jgi:hypothetical protein
MAEIRADWIGAVDPLFAFERIGNRAGRGLVGLEKRGQEHNFRSGDGGLRVGHLPRRVMPLSLADGDRRFADSKPDHTTTGPKWVVQSYRPGLMGCFG